MMNGKSTVLKKEDRKMCNPQIKNKNNSAQTMVES